MRALDVNKWERICVREVEFSKIRHRTALVGKPDPQLLGLSEHLVLRFIMQTVSSELKLNSTTLTKVIN